MAHPPGGTVHVYVKGSPSRSLAVTLSWAVWFSSTGLGAAVGPLVICGGVFAGAAAFTITVIAAEPCKPPLSVTDAVIVWVPTDRVLVENDPPAPMLPFTLEVHARLAVRFPSSASVAVPVNVM